MAFWDCVLTPAGTLRGMHIFRCGLNMKICLLLGRNGEFQRTTQGRNSPLILCRSSLLGEHKGLRLISNTCRFPVRISLPFPVTYTVLYRSTLRIKDPGNSESRNGTCNILRLLCILLFYYKAADQKPRRPCECDSLILQDHGRNIKSLCEAASLSRMFFDLCLE